MTRWVLFLLLSALGLSAVAAKEWILNANGEIVEADGVVVSDPADQAGKRTPQETATARGKSVIIELEDNNAGAPVAKEKKKKSGGKTVELIVGGQGENGVAKRGALIIEK